MGGEVRLLPLFTVVMGDVCASHWVAAKPIRIRKMPRIQFMRWKGSSVSYGVSENGDHRTSSQRFSGWKYIPKHPHLCRCILWTLINESRHRKQKVLLGLLEAHFVGICSIKGSWGRATLTLQHPQPVPPQVNLWQRSSAREEKDKNTNVLTHTRRLSWTRTGLVSGS